MLASASISVRRFLPISSRSDGNISIKTFIEGRYLRNKATTTAIRTMASDTIYKFGVSQEHLDTVNETLPMVAKAGTEFTKHFYRRMFAKNPELLNLFNQTNQARGTQPKRLLETVAVAAQSAISTGELAGEAIEGICQKHAALNITKEAYDIVGANILGTIEDLLTTDVAVLHAWGALYGEIANAFVTRELEIASELGSKPGSWSGRRSFVLNKKEPLSSVITRFQFLPVDNEPVPKFTPGQFTTIWVPIDQVGTYGSYKEQPRHYTLALPRNVEDEKSLSISVKKDGLISGMLHEAEVGTEWELSAPHGCFNTSGVEKLWLTDPNVPVVFISGGVGITPVLAMLENIYETRSATWLHAEKNGDVHAYRDRLREIAAVRGGQIQRRVWYTDPRPEDGLPGDNETNRFLFNLARFHYRGRMDLTNEQLSSDLLHLENSNSQYYMCGPEGFMNLQRESLVKLGVSDNRIHTEGF